MSGLLSDAFFVQTNATTFRTSELERKVRVMEGHQNENNECNESNEC